jgi:hypothetical protein
MPEDNGDPYNPASAAFIGHAAAEAEERELAFEELREVLANAPRPDTNDAIAWLHNYSQWWHGERTKALAKTEPPSGGR